MDNFFANMFRKREAPIGGVPASTMTDDTSTGNGQDVGSGSYQEKIVAVSSQEVACTVSAVYRATQLRADVMGVMPVEYQKKDFEGGNFITDMRGIGRRLNYLMQEEPNPIMTATDLWRLVEINRIMAGNAFVYIERDEFDYPTLLWLVSNCGYNITNATYAFLTFLTDHG